MKYKVGDKVKIRSDLEGDTYVGEMYFSENMKLNYSGKIFTIKKMHGNYYKMEELGENYFWTDEMIEGKVEDMLTYKGWAILKMIADGEIKEGTRLMLIGDFWKEECKYISNNLLDPHDEELSASEIINNDFEIIEEQKELNIQEIKETEVDEYGYLLTHLGAFKGRKMDLAFNDRINELVQAVKELDKRINERFS